MLIEPRLPLQSASGEPFDDTLRDEPLAIELFHSLLDAKVTAEDYRTHYQNYRPHSSLNYQTPNKFTLDWKNNNPGL